MSPRATAEPIASRRSLNYLAAMPGTYAALWAFCVLVVVFNVAQWQVHATRETLYGSWLAFSEPATSLVARYIPAVDDVGQAMRARGLSARVAIMRNVIACDWFLLASFYLIAVAIFAAELPRRHLMLARRLRHVCATTKRPFTLMLLLATILAVGLNLLMAISWTYGPRVALYYADAQFVFIAVLFACTAWFSVAWLFLAANLLFPSHRALLGAVDEEIVRSERGEG